MILAQELQKFVDSIPTISPEKKYWLIRTQSGSLYDNFRDNGFVALEHDEVPLSLITDFSKKFNEDKSKILSAIKKHVTDTHLRLIQPGSDEELNYRKSSLIANQIFKFTFETKKGDIVIIPSAGADLISIGEVMENHIADFTPEQARKIGIESILKKRVRWLKDIKKRDLDPYMYRMFTAHQALNDIGGYADIVERSLHDFFILDGEAHFIINIQKEGEITAPDLFGLGSEILELIDQFADTYKLPVKSSDLAVSINLNSPGKIDLKSKIKITTVFTGILLAVVGGGYNTKTGNSLKTDGLPGLMRAITEFMEANQERSMQQQVFDKYKDSLQVKSPDDMIKLLKQFDENKDNPK